MNILVVTTEWPRFEDDITGIHVINQIHHLEQAGIKVDVFPFRGRKNPINYWQACQAYNRLNLRKYDIVHAHHGQAGIVALSQHLRPVVITFHGSDLQGIRGKYGNVTFLGYILRLSSRWVAMHADAVILVSNHLANFLPRKISFEVIPSGINFKRFRPEAKLLARQALDLPAETRLVLFVGNPDRSEKRYWLAKKAVENLSECIDVRLILAHNIPNERIPRYMNACDVLLITSSTEGSPNVVKEALACNLPIISTDVGDVRQRIEHVKGCLICNDDHSTTITKALEQTLISPSRITGRKTILDMDEVLLTKKVISIYENLVTE